MDDAAAAVHVVEAHENLLGDLLDEGHGNALVLVPLDEPEQILAEDLEDHADVRAVRALVSEVVQERDDVRLARVRLRRRQRWVRVLRRRGYWRVRGRDEPLEELDLVQRGLCVSRRRFDDLEGDMAIQSARRYVARQKRR